MKYPVSDKAVAEFAALVRVGKTAGKLFPARMSDCAFTDKQRLVIQGARAARKIVIKELKASSQLAAQPTPVVPVTPIAKPPGKKGLNKLERLLLFQKGLCFYCRKPLRAEEANIEHLIPKSRGGKREDDNVVVCHRTVNDAFGAADLKRKLDLVLGWGGKFECPGK